MRKLPGVFVFQPNSQRVTRNETVASTINRQSRMANGRSPGMKLRWNAGVRWAAEGWPPHFFKGLVASGPLKKWWQSSQNLRHSVFQTIHISSKLTSPV